MLEIKKKLFQVFSFITRTKPINAVYSSYIYMYIRLCNIKYSIKYRLLKIGNQIA